MIIVVGCSPGLQFDQLSWRQICWHATSVTVVILHVALLGSQATNVILGLGNGSLTKQSRVGVH